MKAESIAECFFHRQTPPHFICTACQSIFCRQCVKVIGSATGGICPRCGSLCLLYKEVMVNRRLSIEQHTAFGFADLQFALRFPLEDKLALLGVSVLYGAGLFSLPFFLIARVGIVIGSFGLLPFLLASALMYGCATLIIRRLETGNTESHDLFDVVQLLADFWSAVKVAAAILLAVSWPWLLSTKYAGQASLVTLPAFGWMIFYYPMAMLMGAFRQSFWSTLNPLVGVNALLKLRGVYFKLLGMTLPLLVGAGVIIVALGKSLLPTGFNIVTLVVYVMFGIFIAPPLFYTNMVLASLIGRVLFKYGERLER